VDSWNTSDLVDFSHQLQYLEAGRLSKSHCIFE
jgi:hypothetical protein